MKYPRSLLPVFVMGAIVLGAPVIYGQDYPNKPLRIVTSSPGGGNDFASRLIAQHISGPLGQPVIVDNRAAPILAAEFVSKSPPDGYTLYVSGNSIWISPLLQKTPYDAVRDFSPITVIVRQVNVVAVHPSLPIKSLKE